MTGGRPTRLVQVAGPGTTGDFAVTADSPLGELLPLLTTALGLGPAAPGGWYVQLDGRLLDPATTPAEAGIVDGDRLLIGTDLPAVVPNPDQAAHADVSTEPRRRRFGTASP